MPGTLTCHRCAKTFDGGNSVGASCPACGTYVFDDDSRPTLLPESYGPGAIVEGKTERKVRPPSGPVDPSAQTLPISASDVVPSDIHFPPVTKIAHYDVLGEIARGGMGVVYRARDKKLNRLVAVKVLLEGAHASSESVERFLREAQSTARLRHPSIVPIHDLGVYEGRNFLVMEYVVGQPLSALIHTTEITPERAVDLMIQVADAVEHAHREGIIHRDIKPANILVDTEWRAKVTDFGLAKAAKGGSDLTKSGTAMGTPYYMPPEQARGDTRLVDQRSDVYAMGAVLYECLAGRPPFVGENDIDTILKVVNDEPLAPSKYGADVSSDLEHVCLKALEKDPALRYASAREFAADLRRFRAGDTVLARGTGLAIRLYRTARRHRALLAAGFAGFAIAVSMFAAGRFARVVREKREPRPPVVAVAPRAPIAPYESRDLSWSGPGWRLGRDGWEVSAPAERRLVADGAVEGALLLQFTLNLDDKDPAELELRLFGNPRNPNEGYRVRFSREGPFLRIVADRRTGAVSPRQQARVPISNPWLPVAVERRVDGLWIWAGGGPTPQLALFDPAPGFKRESREVSFTASGGSARLGGLTLQTESVAWRRSALGVGDRMFELQAWDVARDQYRFAALENPRTDYDWEAVHRVALCELQEAELASEVEGYRRAAEGFARVLREGKTVPAARAAGLALAVAVAHLDNAEEFVALLPGMNLVASIVPSEAEPAYGILQEESPMSPVLQLFQTARMRGKGSPEDLVAQCRKELSECGNHPDLHCSLLMMTLSETLYQESLFSESEKQARDHLKLLELLSEQQAAAGLKGGVANRGKKLKDGEFEVLIRRYGNATMVSGQRQRAREILARSIAHMGRTLEAVGLVDAWLEEASAESISVRAQLMTLKADILRAGGGTEDAVAIYEQLWKMNNEVHGGPAARELVRTHLAAGNIKAARATLDRSAARFRHYQPYFEYDRGIVEIFAGDLEAARRQFEKAAAHPDQDPGMQEACRFLLGKSTRKAVEATLRIAEPRASLEYLSGVAAELAGRPRDALAAYRRAELACVGHDSPWLMARARVMALSR